VKRGDDLREHMLFAAKDVFLDHGFERASMDLIAARAGTTKRTLYAHFENKEKLFLAVIELTRGLALDRLKAPADYGDDPEHALVAFCGRFLETLVWDRSIRMSRLTIAEVERFRDGAARFHEAMFGTAQARLETYLRDRLALTKKSATVAATELLGRVLYPAFTEALFGLGPVIERHDGDGFAPGLDLKPIRTAVADLIQTARAPSRAR
jgi:AcrR family transcriptional regulator